MYVCDYASTFVWLFVLRKQRLQVRLSLVDVCVCEVVSLSTVPSNKYLLINTSVCAWRQQSIMVRSSVMVMNSEAQLLGFESRLYHLLAM